MSRGGVLLAIDRIMPRGLNVEVEVDWPVELSDRIPVMVIRGKIIRSKTIGVALVGVTIASYELHTVSDQSVACEEKKAWDAIATSWIRENTFVVSRKR
jgi:hypothetical protein